MNEPKLYRVVLPWLCAGFEAEGDVIGRCAPILAWAKKIGRAKLTRWVQSKGGTVEQVG